MKGFFTPLAAILVAAVAAAVLLTGFYAKLRMDQWTNAIDAGYAQIDGERMTLRQTGDWNQYHARQTQTYRLVVQLLENKPFGTRLSAEEQSLLDSTRIELSRRENDPSLNPQ